MKIIISENENGDIETEIVDKGSLNKSQGMCITAYMGLCKKSKIKKYDLIYKTALIIKKLYKHIDK